MATRTMSPTTTANSMPEFVSLILCDGTGKTPYYCTILIESAVQGMHNFNSFLPPHAYPHSFRGLDHLTFWIHALLTANGFG
jgi:hypothetical protein